MQITVDRSIVVEAGVEDADEAELSFGFDWLDFFLA